MEGQKNRSSGRARFFKLLLAVVAVMFVVSSGLLGYQLGKNASRGTGVLIDTIVLDPGETAASGRTVNHFLTGRLLNADGTPCEGVTVRLEGYAEDETDAKGKFFFTGIQAGAHTLEVLDGSGAVAADVSLMLEFDREKAVMDLSDGASFLMPESTRMLDLALTLDDSGLQVEENKTYLVTTDGSVMDFTGGKLSVPKDSYAVTPSSNVVASGGYVVVPTRQLVTTPPGGVQLVTPDETAAPGLTLLADSSAVTDSGVEILPDDRVEVPEGDPVQVEDKVLLIEGVNVEVVDVLPPQPEPEEEEQPEGIRPAGTAQLGAGNNTAGGQNGESSGESRPEEQTEPAPTPTSGESAAEDVQALSEGSGEGEPGQEPEASQEPTPTPVPAPKELGVKDWDPNTETTGLEWRQQSTVDLFKNRTTGAELGMEAGMYVIAPGSSGHYEFQLENDNVFPVVYTIKLEEGPLHLPIRYSVIDDYTNYHYFSKYYFGTGKDLVTPAITMEPGSKRVYRIEWIWEYERRLGAAKQDYTDTLAAAKGSVEDRTYYLSVFINAAEVVDESYDDTRYPGVTRH